LAPTQLERDVHWAGCFNQVFVCHDDLQRCRIRLVAWVFIMGFDFGCPRWDTANLRTCWLAMGMNLSADLFKPTGRLGKAFSRPILQRVRRACIRLVAWRIGTNVEV
jgi:hypothetical protein